MGEIFEAEDAVRRGKRIREALRDLSPGLRKSAEEILVSYSGGEREERLVKLLGREKAKKILGYGAI